MSLLLFPSGPHSPFIFLPRVQEGSYDLFRTCPPVNTGQSAPSPFTVSQLHLFAPKHPTLSFFSVWKPGFEAVRCPLTWSGQSTSVSVLRVLLTELFIGEYRCFGLLGKKRRGRNQKKGEPRCHATLSHL